jgi:hypothetical protein
LDQAEERAAAAAAALLEEEDRTTGKKASTKKKKKGKKMGGAQTSTQPPHVQGLNSNLEPSETHGDAQVGDGAFGGHIVLLGDLCASVLQTSPLCCNTVLSIPYAQILAAALASTTIDGEGLGGPKEGGSRVAGAGPEEPAGQHVGAAGEARPPVDCKTTSSQVGT